MIAAAFLAGLGCGFVLTLIACLLVVYWIFKDAKPHNGDHYDSPV